MNKVPMTAAGAGKLQSELKRLKSEDRPNVIKAIAEARSHGDLKENAEYHAAREQQGFIEGRIREIEDKLSNAQIIEVNDLPRNGKVVFGTTVVLADEEAGEERRYQIVGEDEAEAKEGRISITSPVARALIGKDEGDEVEVQTPRGPKAYEIIEVLYL